MRKKRRGLSTGLSVVLSAAVLAGLFVAVGLLYLLMMNEWAFMEREAFLKRVNAEELYVKVDAVINAYVDEEGGVGKVINTGGIDVYLLDMLAIPIEDIGRLRYGREITITNHLEETLIDYQIKITLSSSNFDFSKAEPDGSDIRFYDSYGWKLDYWIEFWDAINEEAIIWVKVPIINPEGETKIYMYYGDPSLSSESCGECVFEFFDDFRDGLDSGKWDIINSHQGEYEVTEKGLNVKSDGDWWGSHDTSLYLVTEDSFDFDYAVEVLFKEEGKNNYQRIFGLRASEATNSRMFAFLFDRDGSHITFVYRDSDGASAGWYGENSGTSAPLGWKRLEFRRIGDKIEGYLNGSLIDFRAVSGWNLTRAALTDTHGKDKWNVFRFILVRKYAGEDPEVSVGSEFVGHPALDLRKSIPADFVDPHIGEHAYIPRGGSSPSLHIECVRCEGHKGAFLVAAFLIPAPLYDEDNPYKNAQYVRVFYHRVKGAEE